MRALVALLLLAACSDPHAGKDGYTFPDRRPLHQTVTVELVLYPDVASLRQEAARRGVADADDVVAFSLLPQSAAARCTVHTIDPARHWQPEYLGHEMAHCFYGTWHG